MQVYQCDSCRDIISDPHRVKMREFDLESVFDNGSYFHISCKRRGKIHLCDKCFKGLNKIALDAINDLEAKNRRS